MRSSRNVNKIQSNNPEEPFQLLQLTRAMHAACWWSDRQPLGSRRISSNSRQSMYMGCALRLLHQSKARSRGSRPHQSAFEIVVVFHHQSVTTWFGSCTISFSCALSHDDRVIESVSTTIFFLTLTPFNNRSSQLSISSRLNHQSFQLQYLYRHSTNERAQPSIMIDWWLCDRNAHKNSYTQIVLSGLNGW